MTELTNTWASGPDVNVTYGSWQQESEAEDHFAAFVERTELFKVFRQVRGRPFAQPHFRDHPASSLTLRADVLLVPTRRLIRAGWAGGVVLIEVKRSGEKIGPGLGQLLDYMRAAWHIDGGIALVATFGFLFPALEQHSALASITTHEHIGTAAISRGRLQFHSGQSRVLTAWEDGRVELGFTDFGRKTGSR